MFIEHINSNQCARGWKEVRFIEYLGKGKGKQRQADSCQAQYGGTSYGGPVERSASLGDWKKTVIQHLICENSIKSVLFIYLYDVMLKIEDYTVYLPCVGLMHWHCFESINPMKTHQNSVIGKEFGYLAFFFKF